MGITEIKQLPLNEKLQLMEALWEDLRDNADATLVPDWHKDLLSARRKAVGEGTEKVLDWDEIKGTLGKQSR